MRREPMGRVGRALNGVMGTFALIFLYGLLWVIPAAAQSEGARAWDGNPDLNGVWQAIGTAHWDL